MKYLSITFSVIVGVFFIFSGVSKFRPIEPLEFNLVANIGIGWSVVPYISRLLISLEVCLGVLLLIKIYPETVRKISLFVLFGFSSYLLYLMAFFPTTEDCGCMGNYLQISPFWGLVRNLFLILFIFLDKKYFSAFFSLENLKKWLLILVVLFSLAFPHIYEPMDINPNNPYQKAANYALDTERIGPVNDLSRTGKVDLSAGKHIVTFVSTGCKFCKMATEKLSIMQQENPKASLVFLIWKTSEDENKVLQFWEDSHSRGYPYKLINEEDFFKMSGPSLPAICFVEDGEVVNKVGFRSLKSDEFKRFFE